METEYRKTNKIAQKKRNPKPRKALDSAYVVYLHGIDRQRRRLVNKLLYVKLFHAIKHFNLPLTDIEAVLRPHHHALRGSVSAPLSELAGRVCALVDEFPKCGALVVAGALGKTEVGYSQKLCALQLWRVFLRAPDTEIKVAAQQSVGLGQCNLLGEYLGRFYHVSVSDSLVSGGAVIRLAVGKTLMEFYEADSKLIKILI